MSAAIAPPGRRVEVARAAHVARRLEAAARDGWEPARVWMSGEGDALEVHVELARSTPGSIARSVLVGPVPFRDGGRLGLRHAPRPHDRGWVTSVAVGGAARDESGTGLSLAFVWRTDPTRSTPWGVHLHPYAGEALHEAPSVRVLAEQGVLVEAHDVVLPRGPGTLSLWHGRPTDEGPSDTGADALDDWMHSHRRRLAADHAQLVVVRDGSVVCSRAYARTGLAPDAGLALRVGSVSKTVTALLAAGVVRRLGLARGLDTALGDLGVRAPGLDRVTLAQLLDHTAGLVTSADLRPDDEAHPLSELRIARDLGRRGAPLRPGDLLAWFERVGHDAAFVRDPCAGKPDYGNEGAILVGEILSRLVLGRDDGYETLVGEVLGACGVDVGARGCLLGAGVARSLARGEAPPRPTSITWVPARFDRGRDVVASPHGDNGPYLGGAAGIAVPLAWIGALLAAIGTRDDPRVPTRGDLEAMLVPSARDPRFGRGIMRGNPSYLPVRRDPASLPRAVRVLPLHHQGRIDGGAALLVHLLPLDPADGMGIAAVVAFDRLGPLDPQTEGAELLALLRPLATAP